VKFTQRALDIFLKVDADNDLISDTRQQLFVLKHRLLATTTHSPLTTTTIEGDYGGQGWGSEPQTLWNSARKNVTFVEDASRGIVHESPSVGV